jgi:hypothetical protein
MKAGEEAVDECCGLGVLNCVCGDSGARFLWVDYSEFTLTSHPVNVKDKDDIL